MLLPNLMHNVEVKADRLADELLNDVATNPRTRSLHQIGRDELRRATYDLYHNLSRWLAAQDEGHIEVAYTARGQEHAQRGIPLEEVVYAQVLAKRHLWNYIRLNDMAETALELYQEEELALLIGDFFDKALYHTVRGYQRVGRP